MVLWNRVTVHLSGYFWGIEPVDFSKFRNWFRSSYYNRRERAIFLEKNNPKMGKIGFFWSIMKVNIVCYILLQMSCLGKCGSWCIGCFKKRLMEQIDFFHAITKSYFSNFWVGVIKKNCAATYWNLKLTVSQEWMNELSWFVCILIVMW